jgi:hypothetical protein
VEQVRRLYIHTDKPEKGKNLLPGSATSSSHLRIENVDKKIVAKESFWGNLEQKY